jgi:hypothetical protein
MKSMSRHALCGIAVFVVLASPAYAEPHPKLPRPREPAAEAPQPSPSRSGVPRGDLRGDIASNARTHGDAPRPPDTRPPKH